MRAGFLLAILFLAGYYSYVAFSELAYLSPTGRLGPGFFPRIIGASLVALCAYSLYADAKASAVGEALSPFWRSAAVVALLTAALVFLLEVLGGLASMIVFMLAALAFLNRGRHVQNLLLALALPACLYLVFVVWLNAAMPRGMLPLPF